MKKLISCLPLIILLGFCPSPQVKAVELAANEVMILNSLARFIDNRPEDQGLRQLHRAARHDNPVVRGLAVAVLFKYSAKDFQPVFLKNFTVVPARGKFAQNEPVLIKVADIAGLVQQRQSDLETLRDERLKKLFLFYYFRHKNVSVVDEYDHQMSLAAFYRVSFFAGVFSRKYDAVRLAQLCDR